MLLLCRDGGRAREGARRSPWPPSRRSSSRASSSPSRRRRRGPLPQSAFGGMFVLDRFGLFFKVLILLACRGDDPLLAAVRRRRRRTRRASTTGSSSSRPSGCSSWRRGRTWRPIYIALELDGALAVRPRGLLQAGDEVARGRREVLRPRRVLVGRPPLRPLARLRRDRNALPRRRRDGARDGGADAAPRRRDHPRRVRPALQDRVGAVPRLGARRVRGRPDADLGLLRGRARSSRPTRSSPGSSSWASVPGASDWTRDHRRLGGPHDGRRERRRADADERQAHARLLVDRARGLRAPRPPRLRDGPTSASGRSSSTSSPTRS